MDTDVAREQPVRKGSELRIRASRRAHGTYDFGVGSRPLSRFLVSVLAALVLLSACGTTPETTQTSAGVETPVEQPNLLVDEFATLDGQTIDLATLQGDEVVLWFWAPW